MSYLIDTDLLSMTERRKAPGKAVRWMQENESELFISVVSIAEAQFGIERAPATHKLTLETWLAEMRRKFAPAIEDLTEAVLVRWKELILDLRNKNRTMTCEDSL